MKKNFIVALALMIIVSTFSIAFADTPLKDQKQEFNLIEYLETNNVNSLDELESVILENTTDSDVMNSINTESVMSSLSKSNSVIEFYIDIDKENELVYVTEVTSSEIQVPQSSKSIIASTNGIVYGKAASAEKNVYSAVGMKVFTVKSEGDFHYDKSSYCKVVEAEGYFTSSFLSMWESSCWIDDRDLGSTAYVKTYGTANLKLSVAETLGINLTFQTMEYKLKLVCDMYGNISSEWEQEVN
ncbi:hypothetical protein [Fusibacter bizertensis]